MLFYHDIRVYESRPAKVRTLFAWVPRLPACRLVEGRRTSEACVPRKKFSQRAALSITLTRIY